MTGVLNSLTVTQSGATAEVVSAEACHIVLDTSPPDYVEKISRYLETSVGQDNVSDGADSDSGESLFLTQKVVPEAVRSRRRRIYSTRSKPVSPRDLEESEYESEEEGPLLASHGESKTDKTESRKKYTLPKYHFPFLEEQKTKPRRTRLLVQKSSLHNYVIGGFFNCVRELWEGYGRGDLEPSLPTVDTNEKDISPLSEEDEERPEDEDIKVVDRKCFLAPSKPRGQQTWCNQVTQQRTKKASKTKPKTPRGGKTELLNKRSVKESKLKDKPMSSRNNRHATRNARARSETQTTERRLTRASSRNLFPQKASEEQQRNDHDAAVCEPSKPKRKQRTEKGREASPAPAETQTDVFHTDGHSSPNLLPSPADLLSDTYDDSVCNETIVQKKKDGVDHDSVEEQKGLSQKEPESATSASAEVEETPTFSEDNRAEPPAVQTPDELGFNDGTGDPSLDDNIARQENGDCPGPKQKKKKRRRKKSGAEYVGEEVDGKVESSVREENFVFLESFNMEECGKKKKKKRNTGAGDVEQLQSDDAEIQKEKKRKTGAGDVEQLQSDDAEIQKKKGRKKEEGSVIKGDCEEDEAANRTLDLTPEQLAESGDCLENAASSQKTLESSHVKRKKHKKKRPLSSVDEGQEGENYADVNFGTDVSVTMHNGSGVSLKKKKKKKKKKETVFEGVDMSFTHEENERVENLDKTQKTNEDLEDQNPEPVIKKKKKKKKKKMSEIFCTNLDNEARNDDSVSVQEKEKKRTSSFLVADAEEKDEHEEQNPPLQSEYPDVSAGDLKEPKDGVTKKKKKRKLSVSQDSMENSCVQDLEEPNKTTDTGLKRKKKRTGIESVSVTPVEKSENAADTGLSPADGPVVLKKKKKRSKHEPCHATQEGLSTATEDVESISSFSSVSHKKKSKHGRDGEISQDSNTSDQVTVDNIVECASASSNTPENQVPNHKKDKKRRKKSTDDGSVIKSAELEPHDNKNKEKKERKKQSAVPVITSSSTIISEPSTSKIKTSSSDKNKHKKVKRTLYNPNEDFVLED